MGRSRLISLGAIAGTDEGAKQVVIANSMALRLTGITREVSRSVGPRGTV